mmetsp:Transcript_40815/g.161689  ORF Transcript_40815/g.161689 Transcript_40815/m.161689 type:complete len:231 (-) Transcript_40815:201-893(-)
MDESTDGAHGKTPVDQLNCLVFLHLRWVLAETKRIKPKVSWCPLALHCRLQSGDTNDRFPARNEKVDLSESTSLHEVVVRIHCKDAFGEIGPWEGEQLRNQEAQCCKHANSAVLDLSFLHPLDVEVVGETQRIKSVVTGQCSVKGRGGLHERHRLGLQHRDNTLPGTHGCTSSALRQRGNSIHETQHLAQVALFFSLASKVLGKIKTTAIRSSPSPKHTFRTPAPILPSH